MAGGGFVEAAATAGPGGGGDGGDSRPRLSSTARAAAAAAAAAASRLGRSGPWRRVAGAGEGGGCAKGWRRRGRGRRRGLRPPRGGPGRGGCWAGVSARLRPQSPAAGREGRRESPLPRGVGPAGWLEKGSPGSLKTKTAPGELGESPRPTVIHFNAV